MNFFKQKMLFRLSLLFVLLVTAQVTNAQAENLQGSYDITAQQLGRIHVDKNRAAIAAIPADFKFVNPGKLTVAVAPSDPPISFYATDAKTPIGVDPDVASAIAESLGLALQLVPITWIDWSLGLSSGKYDAVLANVGVTEERKKKYDFSTYRLGLHGFYVKKESDITHISTPKDLSGLRLIVGAGTNQERILLRWNEILLAEKLPPLRLQYYDDGAVSLLAIQSERADVIVQPNAQLVYIAERDGNIRGVGTLSAGWPDRSDVAVVTRKDSGLAEVVTLVLNGLIASGDYQKILDNWQLGSEALEIAETNPQGLQPE